MAQAARVAAQQEIERVKQQATGSSPVRPIPPQPRPPHPNAPPPLQLPPDHGLMHPFFGLGNVPTSDAEARSLDGLHPRQTNNTEKLRARNQFLRAKVYAMLLLMCKAPEDFSLMLDDDTAVNVTRLRKWLRTRAMATPADRFMLYGGHVNEHRTPTGTFRFVGGGAGILFSRAALGKLCSRPHFGRRSSAIRLVVDRLYVGAAAITRE